MDEQVLWSIGAADGRSPDLIDNYKDPNLLGDVVWRVPQNGQAAAQQFWPSFHPSEADPEADYRLHPYTIVFDLPHQPTAAYVLRIHYLVIAPRLPHLEIEVNGISGRAYLRPTPSHSGEIRLMSGLHTTIYSEGIVEVIIPGPLLNVGENRLCLISRDDGEIIAVRNREAIKRLDRMANGAGLIYQLITLEQLPSAPQQRIARMEIKPTVVYRKREDGALVERCHLYVECNHAVDSGALTLQIRSDDYKDDFKLTLPVTAFGHVRYGFNLLDGSSRVVDYTIDGAIDGEVLHTSGSFRRCRKWNVYITPHAHTDIGYTHRQWEVAERQSRNIDTALDVLASFDPSQSDPPSFSYHLDSTWTLETWLATRGEHRKQQLMVEIQARRISIPSNYVDLLTQYAALEDLIRNGEFTDALLRPLGRRADCAAVVDVASLTGSLPAILQGSGVKYLVHANNQDRGPFRLNGGLHRVSPFYWQGVNGGRVLVWLAKMYCELRKVCGSPPLPTAAERGLDMWLQEYESDEYAPDAVLLYGQEADNTDLDPQPVEFVQQWNTTYAYPRLIASDVSDFFQYVEQNFGETLHTVTGDGGAYWEDGIASSIVPAIEVRRAQAMLIAAERLEALAIVHNADWTYPQQQFDEAWRQVLLWDEHTWGAFLSCRDPDALLQRDQWATKEHMARDAAQWARRLLHTAATRHSLSWNNNGREVVVFNPHSWTISDVVRVEIERSEQVFDAASGVQIPTRRVRTLQTQAVVDLWIDALDGLSYRRLLLQPGADATAAPSAHHRQSGNQHTETIENKHYRLGFDLHRGCVMSWIDKALGKELVDHQDAWGFGQLLYARGGEGTRLVSNQADWPDGYPEILHEFSLVDYAVEHCDFGTSLILRGAVPYGELEVEWFLQNYVKRIDVHYTYHKQERVEKEAVYIAFPLAMPNADVCSDSQLGWVNWDQDQLPGGCKEWLPVQSGILVSAPDTAVLIASPDIPLFCVGNVVQGRWPKQLQLAGGRIFSYVLNNYWHTNYKASQDGTISFGYQLTSDRNIAKDEAFRYGWTARRSLYAQRMSYQDFRQTKVPYTKPDSGCLAVIGSDQVILSTLKQAKWDEGLIVRLQEIAGAAQTVGVSFANRKVIRAWTTDLLEHEIGELALEADGSVRVDVPAWGLTTIRVVLERQGEQPEKGGQQA